MRGGSQNPQGSALAAREGGAISKGRGCGHMMQAAWRHKMREKNRRRRLRPLAKYSAGL